MQNLSFDQKQQVLSDLPNIKLCYDNIIHNKVGNFTKKIYDFCSAIPCGKKCFAWFRQIGNKKVCLILELIDKRNTKNINNIKIVNCVFNDTLTYGNNGTILYGTFFHCLQNSFFTIEDLFYYKNNDVSNNTWLNKLKISKQIFENDIKPIAYNKSFTVFGLPLMTNNINELKDLILDLKYKIYNIQFCVLNKANTIDSILLNKLDDMLSSEIFTPALTQQPSQQPSQQGQPPITVTPTVPTMVPKVALTTNKLIHKNIIFKVKADMQNDIYHLYCMENGKEIFYNIAYIPDYKTSVMMNKLFRNIKENENLDLLEESDDEEEFQNENIDKFVDIDKSLLMICKFNHKFKKWYPVKDFTNQTPSIAEKNELAQYERNYYFNNNNNNNNKPQNNTRFKHKYSNK
jgi:hypothetical protein